MRSSTLPPAGVAAAKSSNARPAARLRSSGRGWDGLQALHSRNLREVDRDCAFRRDDEPAPQAVSQGVDRALHHCGGSFPHGEGADRPVKPSARKRRTHATAPVDCCNRSPEEVQQEFATRIGQRFVEGDVHF